MPLIQQACRGHSPILLWWMVLKATNPGSVRIALELMLAYGICTMLHFKASEANFDASGITTRALQAERDGGGKPRAKITFFPRREALQVAISSFICI